jgi:hypothetical protein
MAHVFTIPPAVHGRVVRTEKDLFSECTFVIYEDGYIEKASSSVHGWKLLDPTPKSPKGSK